MASPLNPRLALLPVSLPSQLRRHEIRDDMLRALFAQAPGEGRRRLVNAPAFCR